MSKSVPCRMQKSVAKRKLCYYVSRLKSWRQGRTMPGMQTPSFGGSPGSGSPSMPGLLPGQVQPRWGPGAVDPLLPNDAQGGIGGLGGPGELGGNGMLSYGQFMGFREQNENSEVQMSEYGLLGAIPKINIKLQSVLDKKGEKYDSRDLARFMFNKDALSEVLAKDMRNTKAYANQLRLAIGSMMSQGSVLESVHEQFLVGRFFKYCHDETAAKLMKQRRIIRDDVEDSWSFDNYMRLVCVENPAKTITFMDCVREWSLKNWKKRGNVTLLTELIRIEDTANDCGFTLCGQNCSLLQKLMIWEEIICRINLPKDLERDIKRLTRRPVVTFEELKHMAVNDQDIVTMDEVRNSDRTVTTIKELEMPTINELQTWFPDATETEINALYPKFGAKRDGKKPFFGGSGGSNSSSSSGSVPYFPGKCAKCGQIGHMARHCKQGDACNICGATDHRNFRAEWRKRRSELDTGFNRENFDSVMMARAIIAFWLGYDIQLPESRVKQAAHTAGGEVFIDGTVLVIYRNEQLKISGVAELIAIDDTEWKGKGASSLLGMRLKNRIGCHTWASETSPRAWFSSGPTIPLEDDKYHIELFAGVTGEFAQQVHEIAKANRGWSLEQVVFAADPAWHSNRVPLKMEEQKLFLKDVSANKITTTVEAQVEKAKFEFKFSNSNQEPPALVHGYRRVHYGVSNMPANRGGRFPDSRASTRVVRDLDQPFGDFLEIDYSFQVKNVFLISRPLDRVRSIVVDYFFEQEEAGSKPVLAPYLFDLPISEEFFQPPLNERFYTMLRPPLTFSGVRVISLQRGDSVPEALSQKHKLHYVPREFYEKKPKPATEIVELLPSPLQEFEGKWCGIAKCVVDRVKAVPAYENFRREIEKTISEKGTIAIVVGDGVLDNVAIVESLKDKVHKNRIRHCSLTWGVDLLLKRITCTGELVPFGVTERTEAELKFDELNRCCRKDPRFGLSRKQLFAFGVAKAIARRTGERGMTKVELMLEAAKQLRRFRYEDVEKACDAVMLTSTRHFRYSANPLRMVRGTWLGVDVRAVSKLDTTFLMEPWSDVGLAVVNVINCFDKQGYGEMVGPKRIVCKREKVEQETLDAISAVAPGTDLTSGHPNGQDVTRVASMAILLRIILRLLIVDPGPENIIRALALLMLGAGMRLRIASGNSARYMAMIERLQLTLKTQLESYRHDPYLSKLHLSVQVILCHMVRNERIRQNLRRTQEPASQRLELMASLPITTPESDSLVFWDEQNKQLTNASGDVIAADAQAVERARIRMGMQLVDKEFQAKIAKLKDQIEKDISAKEPLYEGDLVRYKTKGDDQEPATVVNPVPDREGKVLVKPLGAASKALGVARRFCQRVVDTDLSYVVPPDTVEITELDLPYLPTLLQQIERGDMVARVTGPFVMKTCSDCGERRAIHPKYANLSRMIRCRDFRETICGDISDDILEAQAGWVPPRVPVQGYAPSKWLLPVADGDEDGKQVGRQRVGFEDEPEVRVYDPAVPNVAAPEDANDLVVDPAEEESDDIWENQLPAEDDAAPVDDEAPQPMEIGAMQMSSSRASLKEMPEPHVFDLSVQDLVDITQVHQIRVNQMELANNPNVERVDTEEPMTFRDERLDWSDPVVQEAAINPDNKRFEKVRNWIVDDSIFVPSLHSRDPSSMAKSIVEAYDKTGGPNVEDDTWALFVSCLTQERCWYLDEVSTVWGESEVKRFDPAKVTGDHPERRAFTVFIHKLGEDHFVFSRSNAGAYGAVRFEMDGREAVAKDEPKERMFSIHRAGFTAGMRKKLRKGNKLPDFVPEDLIKGKLSLKEYMVHALVKELRGTITGTSSEGVPCVIIAGEAERAAEAAGVLHSGETPLTSRFLFDIKILTLLFVILKCRWAPGGHMSSKERLELSENGSPTPMSLELKLCFFAGNAMRIPRGVKADVPRAFNDSIQYATHERPRTKITHRGPILDAVIEEAMALFEELEGVHIDFNSEFVVNIAQYGSLEGAVVFWLSNRYKFRKNAIMPSLSSPCVFRVHDEKKSLIVALLEFVDDFVGEIEAENWDWTIHKLGEIYPRLTPDLFEEITNRPETVIGREISFHKVDAKDSADGRPEVYVQVDARNKVGALGKWQSDDEVAKRKGDLDRLLTKGEIERLRSVRGECLYMVTDWRPDCVYAQKVVNFGSDESRTVRHAARQNLIVDLLKQHQLLGIRIRLDLGISNLIFILLVDAGFQARPHKGKTEKDAPDAQLRNRGVMELLEKESQAYSDAKLANMRAMMAYGLFVTSE
eukprot:g20031.t1